VSEAPYPQLIVLNGPHKGVVVVLDQPLPCVIGRRAGLSFPDAALDPVHCQVIPIQGRWYVQDFGSEGGTWLGDQRVQGTQPLELGRSFRIGDTLIALVQPDPDEEEPIDPDRVHSAETRRLAVVAEEVDLSEEAEAPFGRDALADVEAEESGPLPVARVVPEPEADERTQSEGERLVKRKKRRRKADQPASEATDVFELELPQPARSELAAHDVLGDYEVIQPLGEGSLGRAYKCYDRKRRRVVTLKVLDPALARKKSWVARFLRGAKAGARLQHRHVVAILGAGHAQGWIYVVQEYVEGIDLEEHCEMRGGVLEPIDALEIVSKITEALVYAHGRKVIHRAVTPHNVLIGAGGMPKLTDLAFAKRVKKPKDLDVSGAFKAEARSPYAPPEALLGASQVGARADIYGVGACLFRALSGAPPFGQDLGQLNQRILQGEHEPWGPNEAKLSDPLKAMLTRCLEADPAKRYPAMRDLRDAIADLPDLGLA